MLTIISIIGCTILGFIIGAILGACMLQIAYLLFENREAVLATTLIIIGFPITVPYIIYKLIQEHRQNIKFNHMAETQKDAYLQRELDELKLDRAIEMPSNLSNKFIIKPKLY